MTEDDLKQLRAQYDMFGKKYGAVGGIYGELSPLGDIDKLIAEVRRLRSLLRPEPIVSSPLTKDEVNTLDEMAREAQDLGIYFDDGPDSGGDDISDDGVFKFHKHENGAETHILENDFAEHPDVRLELGPEDGNGTKTEVTITTHGGTWDFGVDGDSIIISARGDWERIGLRKAFKFLAENI